MKLSLAVFVFAAKVVSVYGSAAEFPEEDGIVVLTNKTFDSALQQFPKLFVEFCSYQTDTLSLCNNIATYADILCTTLFAFLMFNGCYPRRARSALGVDIVLTLDVCLYVCMFICLYVCMLPL